MINNLGNNNVLISKYITIIMGVVVICFGLSGIIGWHGHILSLVRYESNTIAMVYNTSLSFVLTGIAIITIIYTVRYISAIILGSIFVFSILSLSQHIFNINLGIDQLFFQHYDSVANKFPGRMASNTAICFMLSSLALCLIYLRRNNRNYIYAGCIIGMLILAFSMVFISGYFSKIQHAYAWGSFTPMSITAAVGFVLLAMAIICLAWHKSVIYKVNLFDVMPFALTFCIILSAALLAEKIGEQEQLNKYTTSLPVLVFTYGVALALGVGLLLRLIQITIRANKNAVDTLSLMHATLEATEDGVLVVNLQGDVVVYNQKFAKMWNLYPDVANKYNRQTLTNVIMAQLVNKQEYLLQRKLLLQHPGQVSTGELKLKNGSIFGRHVKPHFVNGKIVGRVICFSDITQQKRLETQLLHQATYDPLTELPNRALLYDILSKAIVNNKQTNKMLAIFLIDVDRFSQMNDTFGRSKGDILLKAIADRLKKTQLANCSFGRIGGDEFLIINSDINSDEEAQEIIHKLFKVMSAPFVLFSKEIKVGVGIGVAYSPKDGMDPDILLNNADMAMMRAKENGTYEFQFYRQEMSVQSMKQFDLETQLHKAIDQEQFVVHYQPILDIKQNRPIGFEALVRWNHPERGIVPPMEFIPYAEELGLIQRIGAQVLLAACIQAKIWHDAGFGDLRISVNVSAHQFKNGDLKRVVKSTLERTGLNPANLDLELTESVLIVGTEEISETLWSLKKLGVSFSIDDFGTGYSSFSYVKRFPIDQIKIDRMFISDATVSMEDLAIVKAMIAMGKSLNFLVLAEGIETTGQLKLLQELGCDLGQGYYFARPMLAEECMQFLEAYKAS
jgi:diguanylate cyclase (GGDEF)-like protein